MPTIYTTGQRIDHYQIIRPLGRGGASHVYLAQDWHALQEVVLKFPYDDVIGGAAVFARYQREAQIGRLLSHPHIQRHLNQGEQRSAEYLVLEYMRGRTLRAVMEKHAPKLLPVDEVQRMLVQVCDALAYAHERGVIHRDIKPENIMLLENGDSKIFDFGMALIEVELLYTSTVQNAFLPTFVEKLRNAGYNVHTAASLYSTLVVLVLS